MNLLTTLVRLVAGLILVTFAWSQTTTADGFVYTTSGGAVTITGYTGPGGAITIPATIGAVPVTRIANSAFRQKTTLTGITFPSSVTTIEAYAFDGCSNLANFTLPSGLQVLEGFSFAFCSALTSVTIPASVITIGRGPFTGCLALTDLTVAAGNANYASTSDGAFILSKDGLNLVQCAPGRSGSITVPATVTHLADNAFDNCQKLTAIALPAGLKVIGGGVFSACTQLSSLSLPEGLTSIGDWAFGNCGVLAGINLPSSLTSLGMSAFQYCGALRTISLPASLTEIKPWTFFLSGLSSITLPSSLTRIDLQAFGSCKNLRAITIPAGVTTLGDGVFTDCANLTTVAFLGNAPTIGAPLFSATSVTTVYYAGGKSGWTSTFSGLPTTVLAAPAISLPPVRQVAAVGQAVTFTVAATGSPAPAYQWRREGTAISGATNATLSLPTVTSANAGGYDVVVTNVAGSVTSTGVPLVVGQAVTDGFVYNEAAAQLTIVGYQGTATSLTIPATLGGKPVTQIGFDAFKANSLLTSVVISEGITTLLQGAFFECPNLTSVVVPSTVSAIGSYAFLGCPKLTTITVAAANPFFSSEAGVLYNQAKTILYQCSGALSGRLVLPSTVTTISANAFWGCSFTSISFPATLTTLAPGAFYGMSSAFTAAYFRGPPPPLTSPGPFDGFASATIYYDSRGPGWGTTYGTRSTAAYDFPAITAQPQSRVLTTPGGTVSLSVTATGGAPLTYQWTRNGQLLTGATQATLLLPNAQAAAVGSYRVTVSNLAGSTTSEPATFEILQPGNTAVQLLEGGGYVAGQPLSVTNVLTYSGTASALSWAVLLPPGWTFASSTATDTSAAPVPGQTDLLEWAWATIPPSPVAFTYTVNVPAGQTGPRELVALAGVRNGTSLQFLAQPDPLMVAEVATHNADTDRNYRISLLELTRVIELYNTRNGTSRTGAYAVAAAATEDGFEPAPARLASATVTLARYHSGDSNRDGKLGLLELTRVIELYNYRSGTSRTGQYKVKSGTEDGFDPGP